MSTVILSLADLDALIRRALVANATTPANAARVAEALVWSEAAGHAGHGASRVPSYAAQARSGKVDGRAEPTAVAAAAAAVRIDAGNGFAFPALALAGEHLVRLAPGAGIAAATVFRSHHFGAGGMHVERLAARGLIGLLFGNSPKAIAPWGGREGIYGTNPIVFGAPRRGHPPLVIDVSLSKVARGKVMVAAREGRAIPEGWALDADGNPTTDPKAALEGTMVPMGDARGSALVMMVEVLAAALSGANFGFEASSFFTAAGSPPGVGQTLIAIDPAALSGGAFAERLETLIAAVLAQPGTRLPGSRRLASREAAERNGVALSKALHDEIAALAAAPA